MPYKQIDELPDSIKNHLPKHTSEIFCAAFNSALEEYQIDTEHSQWWEQLVVAISEMWQWGLILPGRSRKCPLWGIANRLKLKHRFSIVLDYPDQRVKAHPLT